MSNSSTPILQPPGPSQSLADVIGPGIASLFIQGIETGLVMSQLCRWFASPERKEGGHGVALSTLVISVTLVGLAQSGVVFASTWKRYVQEFGKPICPDWSDTTVSLPTLLTSAPVQALMIRRCYYIVGRNKYIITPLVLVLLVSIALSMLSAVQSIQFEATRAAISYLHLPDKVGVSSTFLMSLILPSVLDITLTGILLHYLTRSMKQVYATYIRRRIARLIIIAWQSAVPPTLCSIILCVLYIQFSTAPQKKLQFWFPTVQGMIGKLYVLSLLYNINDYGPMGEQPTGTTFVQTLTVPIEAYETYSIETRNVTDACSPGPTVRVSTMSLNTAV